MLFGEKTGFAYSDQIQPEGLKQSAMAARGIAQQLRVSKAKSLSVCSPAILKPVLFALLIPFFANAGVSQNDKSVDESCSCTPLMLIETSLINGSLVRM